MQTSWSSRRHSVFQAVFSGVIISVLGAYPGAHSSVPLPERKPRAEVQKPSPAASAVASLSAPLASGPLSAEEATLCKEVFTLQMHGKIAEADARLAKIDNGLLMGHVLAERYLHPTATRAKFEDLAYWLDRYSDHPQAGKIYALAQRRMPSGYKGLRKPEKEAGRVPTGNLGIIQAPVDAFTKPRPGSQQAQIKDLSKSIGRHIESAGPNTAWTLLKGKEGQPYLSRTEFDHLRTQIAAAYLYSGRIEEAGKHAEAALRRSGETVPLAAWISGLVNWHEGHYKQAAEAFEAAATSPYASGWLFSAAGYWASRCHMRAGNVQAVSTWLARAAASPRTFYGLLATRALGQDFDLNWAMPELGASEIRSIEETPQGRRARALIQTEQFDLAERELMQLYQEGNLARNETLLAYVDRYRLPSLAMRLGNIMPAPQGLLYDGALYPFIPWEPKGGYRVDKALVHAIIRQESRFNPAAENPSGATGLMQLMPMTASLIAKRAGYGNIEQSALKNPVISLDIGQTYMEQLMRDNAVNGDLLSLAIAYNAGPGNLSKWKSERPTISDPLLFIETIPYAETRAFVERVLANYWIYRMRLGQPTPSLDAVVEGRWAHYTGYEDTVYLAEGR